MLYYVFFFSKIIGKKYLQLKELRKNGPWFYTWPSLQPAIQVLSLLFGLKYFIAKRETEIQTEKVGRGTEKKRKERRKEDDGEERIFFLT